MLLLTKTLASGWRSAIPYSIGITLANLSILKTGKAKAIRFSTLDAICRALDCQPGDLLIHDATVGIDPDDQQGDDA